MVKSNALRRENQPYLIKIHPSVIWIKTVALISILLISTHRANMTLDEVEAILQFEVTKDYSAVKINPEGSLNFLRGYIYQKMECMYNKRFFAPQINTDYLLKNEVIDWGYIQYKYTRDTQMDEAYKALSSSEMDVYNEKYHNYLIELFPSPTGDISIETRGNQSFIQFLRAKTTEKHSLQILAMLLLFSEGVDIPIEFTQSALKVYNPNREKEIYFEVPTEIEWLNAKTGEVEKLEQKKVIRMICFFKEYATNSKVLSLMLDKCTKEEVATGKFLDSPKFLIQSYIFGFIDTTERAKEFIQTVHSMTEKYAPKTEAPSKGDCVYDRLFRPASTATGTDCMALMKRTHEIINMYRDFPFLDNTELPSYTSVPWRDPTTKEFSTNHLEDYSNCVECMILSLFCCLAYDPEKKDYRTDHMGNVSKELKEFFAPEENKSFDTTKVEFQKKWSSVVACLDEPRIAYLRKRNELDCGLINMLLVIAEIVNISEEEKDKILGFSESLSEKEDYGLYNSIREYTKELLKRLSNTENTKIGVSQLKSYKRTNGRYDVFGEIVILFKQGGIKNKIILEISKECGRIEMESAFMEFEDAQVEKLNEIADSCKSGTGFVGNLFAAYVDYEVRKHRRNNQDFMKEQVRKTVESNFADINRLLLIQKISDLEYKAELIDYSIVHSMDQELSPKHPIVRFASNILGSTELQNWEIQERILPVIVCTGLLDRNESSLCCPNIDLKEDTYDRILRNIGEFYFVDYVLKCDISIFIVWLKFCIDNFGSYNENGDYQLLHCIFVRQFFEYIFKDNNMECSNIVDEAITRDYPEKKDAILNDLHYAWFIHLILQNSPNIELVKANFDAIQNPKYILDSFDYNSGKKKITLALTELKDQLCTSEDSIAKFDELIREYAPNPTTSRGAPIYRLL